MKKMHTDHTHGQTQAWTWIFETSCHEPRHFKVSPSFKSMKTKTPKMMGGEE